MMPIKAGVLALLLSLTCSPSARAAAPPAVQTEVAYLLDFMARSGCEFFRNGIWYDAQRAQAHLRAKYDALVADGQIGSTEDFIEKAASVSSMSGMAYQIRCGGGTPIATKEWFSAELARYRNR